MRLGSFRRAGIAAADRNGCSGSTVRYRTRTGGSHYVLCISIRQEEARCVERKSIYFSRSAFANFILMLLIICGASSLRDRILTSTDQQRRSRCKTARLGTLGGLSGHMLCELGWRLHVVMDRGVKGYKMSLEQAAEVSGLDDAAFHAHMVRARHQVFEPPFFCGGGGHREAENRPTVSLAQPRNP
jgi:hypothetical protein